jgi:hypothetical protein
VLTIHIVTIIETHSRNLTKNYIFLEIPYPIPAAIRKTETTQPLWTTDLSTASPELPSPSRMCHVIPTGTRLASVVRVCPTYNLLTLTQY